MEPLSRYVADSSTSNCMCSFHNDDIIRLLILMLDVPKYHLCLRENVSWVVMQYVT